MSFLEMHVGQGTTSIARAKEILGEKRIITPLEASLVFGTKVPIIFPKIKYKEEILESIARQNWRGSKYNDWYLCYIPKLSLSNLSLIFGSEGENSVFFRTDLQSVQSVLLGDDKNWVNQRFSASFALINFRGLFANKQLSEQENLAHDIGCNLTHPTIYLIAAILVFLTRNLPGEEDLYRYFYHRYRTSSGGVVSVGIFEKGCIDIQLRYREDCQFQLLRSSICLK